MCFSAVHLAARQFGLAAVVVCSLSAAAQETIQYSRPVGTDASTKQGDSLIGSSDQNASSFNAPAPLFGGRGPVASFDILPGSQRQNLSGAAAAQWQKSLRDKRNWTLMTPEEILGIQTPEKVLGVNDPNDDSALSPEQRFLKRQDQQAAAGASNIWNRADTSVWNFNQNNNADGDSVFRSKPFDPVDPSARRIGQIRDLAVPGANRGSGGLFGGANSGQRQTWNSPFTSPPPIQKSTPEQLAGMDRFRALMGEAPPPKPAANSAFLVQPTLAPEQDGPVFKSYNPAGATARGLEDDIQRPRGLTPLPGLTGPRPAPPKLTPLVLPPPWLQSPLQNQMPQQRVF